MDRMLKGGLPLLLIFLSFTWIGCGDDSGPVVPNGGNIQYGSPYGVIGFIGYNQGFGTIAEAGTIPQYFYGVGTGAVVGDPAYCALWQPTSDSLDATILVMNRTDSRLYVVNETGITTIIGENVIPGGYDWSSGGSRIVYVMEEENTYTVVVETYGTVEDSFTIAEYATPFRVEGRPVFGGSGLQQITVNVVNDLDPSLSHVDVLNYQGQQQDVIVGRFISPKYSPHDYAKFGYIDGSNGAENATKIYLDGHEYDFSAYGTGATDFSWSPHGNRAAFYVGVFTDYPKLLVVNLSTHSLEELELDSTIAIGSGDDLVWASPAWNTTDDALTLLVKAEDNISYILVTVDMEGTMTTLLDDISELSRPVWRSQ